MPVWNLITETPAPPARPADSHKGTFGSVLLVVGSEGMSGAASLAGQAALHGGAGLVTVAVPRCILPIVASAHPSYMTVPLDSGADGKISRSACEKIKPFLARQTTLAIGPGLGRSDDVRDVVQQLYRDVPQPLVLDADGLNAFVGNPTKLRQRIDDAPRILTPHLGEFARLTDQSTLKSQSDRADIAANFAETHQVILLLKGNRTIVTDGRRLAINPTGDSGLATAGSGDVLTGLIAALLAQSMPPFEAAQLGAYLHGLAGEIASAKYTERYTTSVEILQSLAEAWKQL